MLFRFRWTKVGRKGNNTYIYIFIRKKNGRSAIERTRMKSRRKRRNDWWTETRPPSLCVVPPSPLAFVPLAACDSPP